MLWRGMTSLHKPVNKHELLARVHSLLRLKQFTDELDKRREPYCFSLALSIEAKDPYTEGHCDRPFRNISGRARGQARVAPGPARRSPPEAVLVHDIGKAGPCQEHTPAQTRNRLTSPENEKSWSTHHRDR